MKLSDLNEIKKKYVAEIQANGEKLLKEAFIEFFNKNPEITGISWKQSTPYFNDGDVCEFSVNFGYGVRIFVGEDKLNMDELQYGNEEEKAKYDKYNAIISPFLDELSDVDDDFFLMTFGNDSEVTATRDGFTVEEYNDHD